MVLHILVYQDRYVVEYPPPVGKGTAILRTSVIPGIPEHLIDEFEWMLTSSINI